MVCIWRDWVSVVAKNKPVWYKKIGRSLTLKEVIMIVALSKEAELKHRTESFATVKQGTLFNLGGLRYFIAARPPCSTQIVAIELTAKNKKEILSGQAWRCTTSILHFDEMRCLNIIDDEKSARQRSRFKIKTLSLKGKK